MKWNYGEIYKSIRKGKGLVQTDVCHPQLNRGTLTRIENYNQNTSFETMQHLLNQINVSLEEFEYICNEFQPDAREKIITDYYSLVSNAEIEKINCLKTDCSNYLKKYEDNKIREIYTILTSLIELNSDTSKHISKSTKQLVDKVWERLEKIDTWTYDDIRMINSIFYSLDFDTIIHLIPKLITSLHKYTNYKNVNILHTSLLLNLSFTYMQKKLFKNSMIYLNQAESLAKKLNRVDFIAVAMVRIGICTKNRKNIDDGLTLLRIVANNRLSESLQDEIHDFYPDY
ncbi:MULTISPECIES: Rgg/GadR/MutR family transcriptional regulator [Enterococcus]|uniref:HTH cro/C1-type domain-containing protein n=2 Tax=Enterococcus thailandicus TaxID=417368 RepID=A0A179EPL0_ENTTH|nr:Rgg/GadR/MutR family transcriptional regulator [Enterococcus thailandicus]MDT2752525.1 Rgg/GadR/MutR family transcriptional regulator [Enterococcus thailandicus]MDT2777237.1 Rgg/GadR/MutR family transcriptional regulator [Enterococcus thailandicus]MDT2795494.1 Rgg/GadR/MutR family transcriptional regulator [Enterococcus thailandicus]OAQ55124.1 hypothetical protein A6E74_09675 [Enterococcus thailandicus]